MTKDKIDHIIEAVMEEATVIKNCNCDGCDDYAEISDFKNQFHPKSDYDNLRETLEKILKEG